ncbi:MAG: GNAT family N-acetyltransferase [Oscillospiraceae bacterium]|nr:GNAT family N-acetyltransferase [Oscillospiraceae bacterium]
MIRRATTEDVAGIARIYDEIHTEEEAGRTTTGWIRGIYPTRRTAEDAVQAGEMFVREAEGRIVAAARINQVQDPAYAQAIWQTSAPPERVMVLHTLVVSPAAKGRGYGSSFVRFYEQYARERGCPFLRMDTNVRNTAARALYQRLGYQEGSVVPCTFNGLEGVRLLCLEKTLEQ